ncbi:SMI1/KNR4 family protein [Microlunatus sagamiharensis]|nr:SMI1/KNR4 family protein [Microlunatus sagamiharensis]
MIWSLEELVEMAPSAWCTELSAAGLVAFGTDGAGTSFCLRRDGTPTVLAWYPIDGEARAVAASLADFWTTWTVGGGVVT